MGNQSDARDEKNRDGRRDGRSRSGSPSSTAGSVLHSEGSDRARTFLRYSWNSRRGIGDERRSMGCRIEGYPSFHDPDEGRWRNRKEVPFEASILLSRIGPPSLVDYS